MNESEFFDILGGLKYDWFLIGDKIRAKYEDKILCPINAVALECTGVLIDHAYPMSCGRYMDLDRRFVAKLVQAIDNTHVTPEIAILRNQLLEICNVGVRTTV